MMFQLPSIFFLALTSATTTAMCPAGFSSFSEEGKRLRARWLESTSEGSDCLDTLADLVPANSPWKNCSSDFIKRYPCGTNIEAFGVPVNSVCAETCNACDREVPTDLSFPYTVTHAPFSDESHYTVYTITEDTVLIDTFVPIDTDWVGYNFADINNFMDGGGYHFHLQASQDENGDMVRSVRRLDYLEVKQIEPASEFVKEHIDSPMFDCSDEVIQSIFSPSSSCEYDEETGEGDLLSFIGDDAIVLVATPDPPADKVEIVSVSQDEFNIKISWKIPRTSTMASPNLFMRYADKPTWYVSEYDRRFAGLEYHGKMYRMQTMLDLFPAEGDNSSSTTSGSPTTMQPSFSPSDGSPTTTQSVEDSSSGFSSTSLGFVEVSILLVLSFFGWVFPF